MSLARITIFILFKITRLGISFFKLLAVRVAVRRTVLQWKKASACHFHCTPVDQKHSLHANVARSATARIKHITKAS